MAKTTKLTVKTDVGTFTRTTARTYTHIVVCSGARHEWLEARRQSYLASERKQLADAIAAQQPGFVSKRHPEHHAKWLAEGQYAEWVALHTGRIAKLEAEGVITEDQGGWGVLGWCGRLGLAQKLVTTKQADIYREARIYALDGTRVL